jgi:general secretion pathway protein I
MSRWTGSPAASLSRRSDGFTLIEVLVAFTIAAVLLVAVLRILTLGLDGGKRAEAFTKATIIAESTLDAIGVVTPLKPGEAAELRDGPFRILASVDRFHEPGEATDGARYLVFYRVSATVSWLEGRRRRTVSLSTLRLGPQQ